MRRVTLAVIAVRLAKKDGGRRGAVGNFRDVHALMIRHYILLVKAIFKFYMTTFSFAIHANSFQDGDLREKGGRRSVGWHVSVSTPPSDTALLAIRKCRRKSKAAGLPPLNSTEKSPPG